MIVRNTPIEIYDGIYVKREDLSTRPPLPPLAKLRGVHRLLERLKAQGVTLVGVQDTAVSKAGQGVAVLAESMGLRCIVGIPQKKELPEQHRIAQEHGAELYPLRGNYIGILDSQTRKYVESKGGVMLPFGLVCVETTLAVAEEARGVPESILSGTLVLCAGTGTITSGVLLGLPKLPQRVITISSGINPKKQRETIKKLLLEAQVPVDRYFEAMSKLEMLPAIMPYNEECKVETPFPAHKNYDSKAWKYLYVRTETD